MARPDVLTAVTPQEGEREGYTLFLIYLGHFIAQGQSVNSPGLILFLTGGRAFCDYFLPSVFFCLHFFLVILYIYTHTFSAECWIGLPWVSIPLAAESLNSLKYCILRPPITIPLAASPPPRSPGPAQASPGPDTPTTDRTQPARVLHTPPLPTQKSREVLDTVGSR